MYNPLKYFFDRKIAIPKGMLEDCHPFPMPTRAFLENPDKGSIYAPSKKAKVRTKPDREMWRDHLGKQRMQTFFQLNTLSATNIDITII